MYKCELFARFLPYRTEVEVRVVLASSLGGRRFGLEGLFVCFECNIG
jgi:hypothetical protein